MYVNKGMSTTKIADELNKRQIVAPGVYLKIPIYMKRPSSNGKYVWLRTQISKILKNEIYIGNVVGRKYQKISHKISKVRVTKQEEHVIVEHMHDPIIDLDIWNKAQKKLKEKHITRQRKYDNPLKGLVFCQECGSIATLRCRTETRKSGTVWRADYFICSKRNSYTGLCNCKQISAKLIEEELKKRLKYELEKIKYTKQELRIIFKESQVQIKRKEEMLKEKLSIQEKNLNLINKTIEELYQDKVTKLITMQDFEALYKKQELEKSKVIKQIEDRRLELEKLVKEVEKVDIDFITKNVKEFLKTNNITKEMYQMLVEKIEFDKEKNMYIKFRFSNNTNKVS